MRMENPTPLSESQKVALDKLTASLGPEYVEFLVSQGLEVLTARVEVFLQYEASLLVQIKNKWRRLCLHAMCLFQTKRLRLVHLEWKLKSSQERRVKTSSSRSMRLRWTSDQA